MARKKTESKTVVSRDFPRTLYKPADRSDPKATKWGSDDRGGAFHSLLVRDEKERKVAMQMGWLDDFAKACGTEPIEEEVDASIETQENADPEPEAIEAIEAIEATEEEATGSKSLDEGF